jgi:hypothetical protein
MDYRGKIITLSRYEGLAPKDFICTAHYAGCVEVVPIEVGQEHITYPPIALQGPGLIGTVHNWRNSTRMIDEVKSRCISRLDADFYREGSADQNGIRKNLDRLQSLDGDQPVKLDEPTPRRDAYSAAQNAVFAEIYGGLSVRPNYVGRLVFIEIPIEYDDDGSGEFIVINQSSDSLYVVDTQCCAAGARVYRMPFSDGESHITILDSHEDDDFVREFIDRLEDMDTESYDDSMCDAAETVAHLLARMLERKSKEKTALDLLFGKTDLFFGPIGTTDKRQSEDRCHRVGCNAQCCGV